MSNLMKEKREELPLCANCGTDLNWWVNDKGRTAYHLHNDDYVCSIKCLHIYARDYFNLIPIKKDGE